MHLFAGIAFLCFAGQVHTSFASLVWPEFLEYDPVAAPAALVVDDSGFARFTVLTPCLFRIEYASVERGFEDRATTAFLHRRLDVPKFTVTRTSTSLVIQTSKMRLTYSMGERFSSNTLQVESIAKSAFTTWHYGDYDHQNLLGTIRSLDLIDTTSLNCTIVDGRTVHEEGLHCAWGLASRSGWSVVDDSDTQALNPASGWWEGQNVDEVDQYLFAHGHDYRGALKDFVAIAGKIPMVPRAALGIWWTRWYNLRSGDLRAVVDSYRTRALPLDVFVLDMDWHTKNAWGGYSWDRKVLPYPSDAMAPLKSQGLITLANLHDHDGVGAWEDQYDEFARAIGRDPNEGQHIPSSFCSSQNYTRALEDVVLQPLERDGLDYWWIDWQQGGKVDGCEGGKMNPTIWTNKVRATDHVRRRNDKRGMVLARWGGYGSHRYQVGFSGDVITKGALDSWENLAFQPYFSLTATNVGFGFWSHDIVAPSTDPELYTRWIQWGSYSGVFRSHDRGSSAGDCDDTFPRTATSDTCGVDKVWNVPLHYFEANRAAMQARSRLLPYLYTLVREAYDTGLGPLRPLYYDFPEHDMAYAAAPNGSYAQYMLGDDLMVAPVVTPASSDSHYLAAKRVWIPPGGWIEEGRGRVHNGGRDGKVVESLYALDEVPVLVRAGAVIPSIPLAIGDTIGTAGRPYDALVFTVYPGKSAGACVVYEDDGASTAYSRSGATSAYTYGNYTRTGSLLTFRVRTAGSFPELPAKRKITLRVAVSTLPVAVMANGASLPYSRFAKIGAWTYEGMTTTTHIEIPEALVKDTCVVSIDFGPTVAQASPAGLRGALHLSNLAKEALDQIRQTPGAQTVQPARLEATAVVGDILEYNAGQNSTQWKETVMSFGTKLDGAIAEIRVLKPANDNEARRFDHALALLNEGANCL
ncbi:hypothetical protein CYMTET_56397 [Cymbomonas tetramitiformis]|uniref:DUF5110 domain-containing protein n=1 Tax=Cymbomonas tetramitiformis TaxID=36881 RepID=A0AAE0BC87_9CHLO|nr:hypothetical protein CYMTET_56397 [Cymbomonas tetramitiformis]|eukprot:gene2941-3754_t